MQTAQESETSRAADLAEKAEKSVVRIIQQDCFREDTAALLDGWPLLRTSSVLK